VMMMDDYKNSDNFQRTEGCKMISPHHFHPTNGVSPEDVDALKRMVKMNRKRASHKSHRTH
jgi:hypothetical protein